MDELRGLGDCVNVACRFVGPDVRARILPVAGGPARAFFLYYSAQLGFALLKVAHDEEECDRVIRRQGPFETEVEGAAGPRVVSERREWLAAAPSAREVVKAVRVFPDEGLQLSRGDADRGDCAE